MIFLHMIMIVIIIMMVCVPRREKTDLMVIMILMIHGGLSIAAKKRLKTRRRHHSLAYRLSHVLRFCCMLTFMRRWLTVGDFSVFDFENQLFALEAVLCPVEKKQL